MAIGRWYPSKIDWWLAILLAVAPMTAIGGLFGAVAAGSGVAAALTGVLVLAAVYVGLVFPTRYGIDDGHLVVRHGIMRQHIALTAITEVWLTRNPLSSPALSLDRIAIKFGHGFFKSTMVSPDDKVAFLAELAHRARLRRVGDRLVR
jgi:hypothetical protein